MKDTPRAANESWDIYWQGMRGNEHSQAGGTSEPAIDAFWQGVFEAHLFSRDPDQSLVLELACGSGDVTAHVMSRSPGYRTVCADVSPSALLAARARHPTCAYVAFDAGAPALAEASCDLVVSQFGIEYAGLPALSRAAGLVAPGGVLALVLHLREGVIYRQYQESLAIIREVADSKLLPRVEKAFRAGFALHKGSGDRAALRRAEKRMKPALKKLESMLATHAPGVADGLPHRLYQDIAHMYPRLSAYDKAEVMRWFRAMERELGAYDGRLRSMLAAAVDATTLDTMVQRWDDEGLRLLRRDSLNLGRTSAPGAWALVLERAN